MTATAPRHHAAPLAATALRHHAATAPRRPAAPLAATAPLGGRP